MTRSKSKPVAQRQVWPCFNCGQLFTLAGLSKHLAAPENSACKERALNPK